MFVKNFKAHSPCSADLATKGWWKQEHTGDTSQHNSNGIIVHGVHGDVFISDLQSLPKLSVG